MLSIYFYFNKFETEAPFTVCSIYLHSTAKIVLGVPEPIRAQLAIHRSSNDGVTHFSRAMPEDWM